MAYALFGRFNSYFFTIPFSSIKEVELAGPREVTIKDGMMYVVGKKCEAIRLVKNVKKVIDFGEWYHIFFLFGFKSPYFVCQKDLLVQGTIEEFERLFDDIIERRDQKLSNEQLPG